MMFSGYETLLMLSHAPPRKYADEIEHALDNAFLARAYDSKATINTNDYQSAKEIIKLARAVSKQFGDTGFLRNVFNAMPSKWRKEFNNILEELELKPFLERAE